MSGIQVLQAFSIDGDCDGEIITYAQAKVHNNDIWFLYDDGEWHSCGNPLKWFKENGDTDKLTNWGFKLLEGVELECIFHEFAEYFSPHV